MQAQHDPSGYHDPLHSNGRRLRRFRRHRSHPFLPAAALHKIFRMPEECHGHPGSSVHKLSRDPYVLPAPEVRIRG